MADKPSLFAISWPPRKALPSEAADGDTGDSYLAFHDQSSQSSDNTPSEALLLAILDDALRLIQGGLHPAQHIERQEAYHDACRWLDSMEGTGQHIRFEFICEVFGLEPDTTRAAIWSFDGRTRKRGRQWKV